MKSMIVRGMRAVFLCTVGFTLAATSDTQAAEPIRGQHTEFMWQGLAAVGVTVTNKPGAVTRVKTDGKGQIALKALPPGVYELAVDGPSLMAAMDKLAPQHAGLAQSNSHSSGGMDSKMSGGGNGSATGWLRLEFEVGYSTHDSIDVPYRRDSAGKDLRMKFTIQNGAEPLTARIFATNIFDKRNPTGAY